eukprot:SAG22_NODE_1190_length_5206_cov_1.878990_5_plen_167_part_00
MRFRSTRGLYGGGAGMAQYVQLLFNASARTAWIAQTVAGINAQGADGINFDIEGNEELGNSSHAELKQLLVELRAAGEKTNPHFQISFCSPVYPAQPQLKHANDWAGMIKPNGPVDFCAPPPPACPRLPIAPRALSTDSDGPVGLTGSFALIHRPASGKTYRWATT